jgi:hypothetical protein
VVESCLATTARAACPLTKAHDQLAGLSGQAQHPRVRQRSVPEIARSLRTIDGERSRAGHCNVMGARKLPVSDTSAGTQARRIGTALVRV